MRIILFVLFLFFAAACSKTVDVTKLNMHFVQADALALLKKNKDVSVNLDLSSYKELHKLKILNAYTTSEGLYIVIDEFLWQEEGLFIPRNGIEVNTDIGNDPSYISLGNRVYKFNSEG